MSPSILSILYLLCSFLPSSSMIDVSNLYERWQGEITQSLRRNIVGCTYQQSDKYQENVMHSKPPSNSFELNVLHPTIEVADLFNKFKPQLTLANRNFSALGIEFRGLTKEKYGNTENDRSWLFPDDSPLQNHSNCFRLMVAASGDKPISIYDSYYPIDRSFYLLRIANGVVYHDGAVGASCGRYIGKEGCDSHGDNEKNCYPACLDYLRRNNLTWFDLWRPQRFYASENADMLDQCMCLLKPRTNGYAWNITRTDKVFVSTASYDHSYHHIVADSLPRLAHYIPFLQHHPHIKIHFLGFEHFAAGYMSDDLKIHQAQQLRYRLLDLLHINRSRVVHNAVIANEVYIPRIMRCSHPGSNPVELRLLAMHLLRGSYRYISNNLHKLDPLLLPHFNARKHDSPRSLKFFSQSQFAANSSSSSQSKVMLIIRRKSGERSWSDSFTEQISQSLKDRFANFTVLMIDDGRSKQDDYCLACDFFLYSIADVLVGEHGAGLTNMVFMQTGSLVIETAVDIDPRHLPMCGYYNPMAGGLGIHHYIHSYSSDHQEYAFRPKFMANEAYEYYQNLTLYNQGAWHDFARV